ncbi:hypothetical protein JCM3765_004365 [Sporobolomyces pararoseus]
MLSPNSHRSTASRPHSSPRFDPSTTTSSSNSKRLSRISPSEFDNFLSSSSTKHKTLLDETSLGQSPNSSFEQEEQDQEQVDLSPVVTPEKKQDEFKRRSMFRSVGNASSPDLASLIKKAREQRAYAQTTITDPQEEEEEEETETEREREKEFEFESPTKPRAQTNRELTDDDDEDEEEEDHSTTTTKKQNNKTLRTRSNTSPEITLSEFAASTPSTTTARQIFTSSPRLSSSSSSTTNRIRESTNESSSSSTTTTTSNNGFVLIPPPPPAQPQSQSQSPERTLTSTVQALKNQRQQQQQPQLSQGGGGAGTNLFGVTNNNNRSTTSLLSTRNGSYQETTTTTSDSGGGGGKMSLGNTMKKTSRFFKKFGPSGSSNTTTSSSTFNPHYSTTTKDETMNRNSLPSLSANSSSASSSSTTTTTPTRQLPPPVPPIPSNYTSPTKNDSSISPTRSLKQPTSTSSTPEKEKEKEKGEGDRLRNELRMWRLGVDGVLLNGNTTTTTTTTTDKRRPSLPERITRSNSGGGGGEAVKMGRNKSLPVSSSSSIRDGNGNGNGNDLPSFKLSSPPSPTTSSSSSPIKTLSSNSRMNSIPESTNHSRENSNNTATPSVISSSPEILLPMSPPMIPIPSSSSSSSSRRMMNNRQQNSRVSIVGYPSTSNSSPTPSSSTNSLTPTTLNLPLSPSSSSPSTEASPRLLAVAASPSSISSSTTSTIRNSSSPTITKQLANLNTSNLTREEFESRAKEFAELCWKEQGGEQSEETEQGNNNNNNKSSSFFFLERKKIATWLGTNQELNQKVLEFYFEKFDFSQCDSRLDLAFRKLCSKLYLKGETQQVDRILQEFSKKFYKDNPKSPYSSPDVVHAVSYSMLLLNTDLHVVDQSGSSRMTRNQFVRNTLNAIFDQADQTTTTEEPGGEVFNPGKEGSRPTTATSTTTTGVNGLGSSQRSESALTVGSTSSQKSLEINLQLVLKDMYNAIRNQPIYQTSSSSFTTDDGSGGGGASSSTLNLSNLNSSSRPSLSLSPTATTTQGSYSPYSNLSNSSMIGGGGFNNNNRNNVGSNSIRRTATTSSSNSNSNKRSSVRGFGALLGSAMTGNNNSSLDLIRTETTSSTRSEEGLRVGGGVYHSIPTIGFANSLSHTIIREQHEFEETTTPINSVQDDDDKRSIKSFSSTVSITDEELSLLGAPWAKEGILEKKHYWQSFGKRAKNKDRNWEKVFVVVNKGELTMFRFDGSNGNGKKGGGSGGGIVGGGDWTSNASNVGSISLIHSLTSSMPPPGYSKDRPNCLVLTLAGTGSTFFFQCGTPDLVSEWVATCNYWSARLSREPLTGGVSNVEYGWNKVETRFNNNDNDEPFEENRNREEDLMSIKSGKSNHSRKSFAPSTFNSVYSSGSGGGGGGGNVNDSIRIEDWKPPNVPLTPSQLSEEAQLEHLKKHVEIVQKELQHHNELRNPMIKLYSPRSSNYLKALANWERKSQHLLSEIVKWSTYIEALTSAVKLRSIQRGKKQVEAMLKSADLNQDEEEEDDDELVSRLSPFDEAPTTSTTTIEGIKRLQIDSTRNIQDQQEGAGGRRRSYPTNSRSSLTTSSSTRGEEFFDSNDTTPPAL